MSFDHDGIESTVERASDALASENREVEPATARSIASVLLDDAAWYRAYAEWRPLPTELAFKFRFFPLIRALRDAAESYSRRIGSFSHPPFSRPADVTVAGRPVSTYIDDAQRQFLLGAAILQTEWYVDAADHHGVAVPVGLLERSTEEFAAYFAGEREEFSPQVRTFQAELLRESVRWVTRFERRFGRASLLDAEGISDTAEQNIDRMETFLERELRAQ
ncbi:hypothetical protein M0R88_11910 [Halorussus gelatinilyticus]|uniref:DUF8116 domain-containing protein n=1 Tax=Halorussus gelatinilyticus TaxID=2937524 RepID=A0A8U0IEW6_9EURY|nr:hypothetical protein [Halorussus gelatinilyticus]UPV99230.1 hypothetical protein M0R88_11910 [Halorussus gelatinilyticus]